MKLVPTAYMKFFFCKYKNIIPRHQIQHMYTFFHWIKFMAKIELQYLVVVHVYLFKKLQLVSYHESRTINQCILVTSSLACLAQICVDIFPLFS